MVLFYACLCYIFTYIHVIIYVKIQSFHFYMSTIASSMTYGKRKWTAAFGPYG